MSPNRYRLACAVCLLMAGALLCPPSAHGATETWVGNTSALFDDTNWVGTNNPPISGDSLVFGAAGTAGTTLTDNLMTPGTFNIAGITYNAGAAAFTINPNTAGTNGFTLTGNVTNNSTSLETINDRIAMTAVRNFKTTAGGGDITLGGTVSGGGITKFGVGTLTLTAANTYTGVTTIRGGTLEVATGGSIATISSDTIIGNSNGDIATLNITGGTFSNRICTLGNNSGSSGTATVSSGTWTNSAELYVGNLGTGVLNVTGGTVSNDLGVLGYFAGSRGTATVSSGTWSNRLEVSVGGSGIGVLNVTGGTVSSDGGRIGGSAGSSGTATVSSGNWINSSYFYVGLSGTGALNVIGTGVVNAGGGTGTVTLGNNSTGNGTLNLGTGGVAGTLNAATVTGGSGAAVVNFNHTGNYTFAPQLTGGLVVNKLGAGTTTLTTANTYTGGTTVSEGTLRVNNASGSGTGSGDVEVDTSAWIEGTGSIVTGTGKSVKIIGGTLSVGDSSLVTPAAAHVLVSTVTGSGIGLNFSSGGTLAFDLFSGVGGGNNSGSASAADVLQITGNINITGSNIFKLVNLSGSTAFAIGDRWKLLDWSTIGTGAISGTFSTYDLPTLSGLNWDTSNLFVTTGALSGTIAIVSAVPEPSRALLLFMGLAVAVLRRRRRR